jgi:hypothetical protein
LPRTLQWSNLEIKMRKWREVEAWKIEGDRREIEDVE